MKQLHKLIINEMGQQGVTPYKLAISVGANHSTITRFLSRGNFNRVHFKTVFDIMIALKIPFSVLDEIK